MVVLFFLLSLLLLSVGRVVDDLQCSICLRSSELSTAVLSMEVVLAAPFGRRCSICLRSSELSMVVLSVAVIFAAVFGRSSMFRRRSSVSFSEMIIAWSSV